MEVCDWLEVSHFKMNTLAPPPELSHATLDAALSAVRAYALSQGYAVLSKRRRRIGNKKDELSRDSILCVPTGPNKPVVHEGSCRVRDN